MLSKKEAAMEQLKIELRSILLSAKHGVAEKDIRSDYEMLTCQQLPFRDLGFNDVASLLRAMPDVAKELRSPSGEITYHAVCDDSTAHIQKLVRNQTTKKKTRGRGKGRGGVFRGRGGTRGGRGRGQGGWDWGRKASPAKPRLPRGMRGGRQPRASSFSSVSDGSGDGDKASGFAGRTRADDDGREIPKRGGFGSGRAQVEGSFADCNASQFDSDDPNASGLNNGRGSDSPMVNLKIGFNRGGQRTVSRPASHLKSLKEKAGNYDGGDLRDLLNQRRAQQGLTDSGDDCDVSAGTQGGRGVKAQKSSAGVGRGKKVAPSNTNWENYHRNLPPRFLRKRQEEDDQKRQVYPTPEEMNPHANTQQSKAGSELEASPGYTPPWSAGVLQQLQTTVDNLNSTPPTSAPASPQQQQQQQQPQVAPSQRDQSFLPVMEKIYKMLTSQGLWMKQVPKFFHEKYGQPLHIDFASLAPQWTDLFSVEEPICGRAIVYPVAEALGEKLSLPIDATNTNTTGEAKANVQLESSCSTGVDHLPAVGTKLDVIFSFAYSATDLYVQRADMEELLYKLEDTLNEKCSSLPSPNVSSVLVDSLMAALYEGGWYRAQVKTGEPQSVIVYFIDYGNSEKVRMEDLRHIPTDNKLMLNTQPLAIKCALRKTEEGEWRKDASGVLTKVSENCKVLSATVVDHKGDRCIIDLSLPDGTLINSMLIQDQQQQQQPSTPQLQKQQQQQVTPTTRELQNQTTLQDTPSGSKLFADDPDPLVIPDADIFAVYVCRVMSECSVLLRVVDEEYSDKLDELEVSIAENFDNWPIPQKIMRSNIYAAVVPADYGEVEEEEEAEQSKYHRVRVLKEDKDGAFECYLPDHGHYETIKKDQLREIDPHINSSLSYQAVLANLHGLEHLPDKYRPLVTELLINLLVSASIPFYAVKAGHSAKGREEESGDVDREVLNKVRKIICCMTDVNPANVAQIYKDVFHQDLERVEEVIKHIPGYGYWRESPTVELIDTSQEETDMNINELVLTAIQEMKEVESQGRNPREVIENLVGSSSTSQADTDAASLEEGAENPAVVRGLRGDGLSTLTSEQGQERLEAASSVQKLEELESVTTKLNHVKDYVQELPSRCGMGAVTSSKNLYTWSTAKPESSDSAGLLRPQTGPSSSSSSMPSVCNNLEGSTPPPLPKYWPCPVLTSVALHIVHVESPSDFVAIPSDQKRVLEKMEAAMSDYFSTPKQPATIFSQDVLYAAKHDSFYRRALYILSVGKLAKVFFPDHYTYDTVFASELFVLPEQFYSLPFLAYRMRLGGVIPASSHWPVEVIDWFKKSFNHKTVYGIITDDNSNNNNNSSNNSSSHHHIPSILVTRLIDTSGQEDIVVNEYMETIGYAKCDPRDS